MAIPRKILERLQYQTFMIVEGSTNLPLMQGTTNRLKQVYFAVLDPCCILPLLAGENKISTSLPSLPKLYCLWWMVYFFAYAHPKFGKIQEKSVSQV